jgi:hypothetical protein
MSPNRGELSNKSANAQGAIKMSPIKKMVLKESQVSKTAITKKESTNPRRKESKKAAASQGQGLDMPDFLAEYFSRNEYDTAVEESKKPILPKRSEQT